MKKSILLLLSVIIVKAAVTQPSENTFLWKITSGPNRQASYLFGTIHIGKAAFLNFSDSLYHAINSTDSFFTEIDFKNELLTVAMNKADYFTNKLKHLDSLSTLPQWKKMVERMNKKYHTNVNPDSLDQFLQFSQKQREDVYATDPGFKAMDMMLADHAAATGKKTGGLETMMLQLDLLYQLIDLKMTDSTLNFDEEEQMNKGLRRYYLAEQLDSIAALFASMNPQFVKLMLNNRNITMADSISMHLDNGPCFFAVGCGHLVGKAGLISLLRGKGYRLTPVHSNTRFPVQLVYQVNKGVLKALKTEATENWTVPAGETAATPELQQQLETLRRMAKKMLDEENKRAAKKTIKKKPTD